MLKGYSRIKLSLLIIGIFLLLLLSGLAANIFSSAILARLSFSTGIEEWTKVKITNDLLSGEYRKNIQEGYGLEVYQETSEFCISQGKDSCTYLACRIYTSSDKKDWIPCSIEQDERGNYYVYNLLD